MKLDYELKVHDGSTSAYILDNNRINVTVVVYCRPLKFYYIYLTPDTFAKHISPYVGPMMDTYIGDWTLTNRKMMDFEATRPFLPSAGDDSTSGN